MDYLEIRELYHADLMEKEKTRLINEFEIFNTDFLDDLPYQVRNVLDSLKWRFHTEDWFPEAWEKYRQHVLEAGLGGQIKMPGYIFNPYLERYVDEHFRKSNNNLGECRYSDMEIGEYLAHHGIKGQKWGIRRFQNEDGSLTAEGRQRYGVNGDGQMSKEGKKLYKQDQKQVKIANRSKAKQGVIGGLKGMGIAEVGALAATGALAITGVMILKNENIPLSKYRHNGEQLLKATDILSKTINVAIPAATAVGAGVAIKKQEKTRERLNNQ